MAAETHPSSSSSSDNYDVFLSFRGEDTRRNFTDHLYNALIKASIQTFRDSEELHHGEEIGPKLLKSIEQSRISIPIFSKNYASSKWCLQELTKIMECKKTCGQIVLPIFYKVEPSHVRNQTGCFEEAFLKHEKEQCKEMVRVWRQALKEAGNLKGWDSEDPEYSLESSDLIKSVVERVSAEVIPIIALHVAKHPIGIESRVEEVMRMLDVESQGVLFVGIHGMGGIGKTTMARAIFNKISKQFESKRFLEDVKENASQVQGLVKLQNDLASDLLKEGEQRIDNVASGINVIKKLFCNKKVLIVLDDVDHNKQLESLAGGCDWFGSGSRIIITTRDENILKVNKVDKSKIYTPNELDGDLSLQLFSKYAFESDQPPQDLKDLSKGIVSVLGGLPLAIEVVGSFLCDEKEHMVWEDTLNTLRESPDAEVYEKLKISYDGLNHPVLKKLFLDIACFFIGMDIESVIPAWQACGYYPRQRIMVLVHKSLVKIDNDNKLRIHDQLRDMGREIVRQENLNNPGERSRLWSHNEALEVLKKYKGTRIVEGLFLDFGYQAKNHRIDFDYESNNYSSDFYYEEENYDCDHEAEKLPQIDPADLLTKAFEKMSDLRLLQVNHADHDRNNFGHLPQGLKWLSLKVISSKCVPKISHLEKLAVLDLSGSDITDDWNGWLQIQAIKTLKVLDLSSCIFLKSTPHFSCDTSLERLILDHCTSLVAFHESIGHLQKLVFLSLDYCENLTELSDSICKLSSIRSLILSHCFKLQKLPKELGNMESLTELIIDRTGIEEIPDSIGLLEKLERLNATHCDELTELPNSICKLSSIRSLILFDCFRLKKLPKELGNIQSLTELIIDHTIIEEIPDSIGLLEKLERLSARECMSLVKLPHSMGTMESLTELIIDGTRIKEIPDSVGLLEKLKILSARDCKKLEKLPNLSKFRSLQAVCLSDCWKLFEIQGMSGLSLLQQLDLRNCRTLKLLPELPPGLIKLIISGCDSMERLPNLSTLKSLKELRLHECIELAKIEGIDGLTLLQKLHLAWCENLQSLPELPSSLIELNVVNCSSIKRLPNLSNLKNLQALLLYGCEKLSEIQGISDLPLLQQLDLKRCITLQSLPELSPSLIRLDVSSCISMKRLPNLSTMKHLKEFSLVDYYRQDKIDRDTDEPSPLEELDSTDCMKLQSLPELPSSLIKLDARYCGSIETLPNLSNLKKLQVFHLCCSNLSEIQDISGLSLLQELDLEDCKMLQSLPGLPPSLIRLDIKGYISTKRLPNLSSLRSLKVLRLNNCMNLDNIQGMNDLTLLQELYLRGCSKLQSISELPLSLTRLHVSYCENLFEIQGISDLTLLQTLHLHSCRELQSLDLSNLRILESLTLEDCDNLAKIRGLESLESLIDLQVYRCYTYVKTLPKSVAEGMLPTAAFKERLISKTYLVPDDDNIKGMIFYFVYQLWQVPQEPDGFYIEVEILRDDAKGTIRCVHDLRIEGMNANTDKDHQFYSCYFQGLTWFGFPLKKRDTIYLLRDGPGIGRVCVSVYGLVIEYEAIEDSQELEKRVVCLITPTAKKRPREYDDADPSNWKLWG